MTARPAARRGLLVAIAVTVAIAAVAFVSLAARYSVVPSARGPLEIEVPAGDSLRLFVLGDVGADTPAQHAVARAMEARCAAVGADGIVLVGDNVYDTSTDPAPWRKMVEQTWGTPCLGRLPIYAMLGNHDYQHDPLAEVDYSLANPRWHLPNRFYRVKFGELLDLIVYDSWLPDICGNAERCSLDFLRASLSKADAPWIVVASHYPLQSPSARGWTRRGGLRGWLARRFVCGRADVFLAGHNHFLEHSLDPDCGVESLVTGGAGARLRELDGGGEGVRFSRSVNGFLELGATAERMEFRFFDNDGGELYEYAKGRADR